MGIAIIYEIFEIAGGDKKQIYNQALKWLKRINATILEEKPDHISSLHVKRMSADAKYVWSHWNPYYWEKIINIDILKKNERLDILFSIELVDKPHTFNEIRERWWGLILLDFMNYLDIKDDNLVKSRYTPKIIDRMIKDMLFSEVNIAPILLIIFGMVFIYFDGVNSIGLVLLLTSSFFILPMLDWYARIKKLASY